MNSVRVRLKRLLCETGDPRTSAKCGKSNTLMQSEILDVGWAGYRRFFY